MQKILHSKILGQGFPFLILHGLFGMGDNWITLGRQYAKDFQTHLIDLRNHGRSFHDDIMDYELMVADLIAYCTFHDLKKIYLMGHSMGGKVAMFAAQKNPELVEKLIIVDIAPKTYSDRHSQIFEVLQKIEFNKIQTRNELEKEFSIFIESQAIIQFLLKNVYRQTSHNFAYRFNLQVLAENYHLLNESLNPCRNFKGKTLFLKGQNSDYILGSDFDKINTSFPNAEIMEIAHAGHWLHAENPKDFYQKTMDFLK